MNSNVSDREKASAIISISGPEVLLSRIERQKNMQQNVYKEILQNLVLGYESKLKYAGYFEGFRFSVNFYSRAHIIVKIDKSYTETLSGVLFSGKADEQTIRLMNELSYQFIK